MFIYIGERSPTIDRLNMKTTGTLLKWLKPAIVVIALNSNVHCNAFSGGDGSEGNPFKISSENDWRELAGTNALSTYGKYYELTQDIAVSYGVGASDSPFYGNFDGKGHTLLINIGSGNYNTTLGAFGSTNNAVIRNLTVKGVITIFSSDYALCVGGICGKSVSCEFSNCTNQVSIDFSQCRYHNECYIGGICGHATSSSKFVSCRNNSPIKSPGESGYWILTGGILGNSEGSIIESCQNTQLISGQTWQSTSIYHTDMVRTGGIVGNSEGDVIKNCYNTGAVSSIMLTNLGSNVRVSGFAGGIIGYGNMTVIDNTYNTGNVRCGYSGSFTNRYSPSAGGIFGYSSSQGIITTNCFVSNCTISVTTDGWCGFIGTNATSSNCYHTNSAKISLGNGATEYKMGATCDANLVSSREWLESTLNWDLDNIWYQESGESLPLLKRDPIVEILEADWIYGVTVSDFLTSSNNYTPIVLTSVDGSMKIEDDSCTPIKVGSAKLRVTQESYGQWRSYQTTYDLNVKQKELVVTAPNLSVTYGDDIPEIKLSYSGFVFDDNETVLAKKPVIDCGAYKGCNAGKYPIVVTNGSAKNYTLTHRNGQLTVDKASQDILWQQEVSDVKVGEEIYLNATASSGLPISYQVEDEYVTVLDETDGGISIKFIKDGQTVIKATQSGNENYNPADAKTKEFIITKPAGIESGKADLVNIKPSNGTLIIGGLHPGAIVMVYGLDGSLLKSITVNGAEEQVCISIHGVYIIKVDSKTFKVIV